MTDVSDTHAWADVFGHLVQGRELAPLQAEWAMEQVMSGSATPGQIGAFLLGLRSKGEHPTEVAAFVDIMLRHARLISGGENAVDTCGTGGDASGTANLSTMAALVVAATGRPVVKHGNRAASSQSGSADVLQALGIPIELAPDAVEECLHRVGITFCFAPIFHPAMKYAGPIRRELGIPTVFNILGPLANPARPRAQLVGVSRAALGPLVAQALSIRGTSALVVHGHDGLDEITTTSSSTVWDARGDEVVESTIDAADLGVLRPAPHALRGGDAARNAAIAEAVLANEPGVAAVIDAVCVNAAAALVAAEEPQGATFADQWAAAFARSRAAIQDGSAADLLHRWRSVATELAD